MIVSAPDRRSRKTLTTTRGERTLLVYLLAASHSGSTLLALLLGSHHQIGTVGELKATSFGDADHYLCSCGERIRTCSFWRSVSASMEARGIPFDITDAGTDLNTGQSRYARRLLRPLHRGLLAETVRDVALWMDPGWRQRLAAIMDRNHAFAETLRDELGVRMIVDSSKIGLRLKYLLRDPRLDVRVIRLIRDGRGVALTYTQPREYADATNPALRGGGSGRRSVEAGRPISAGAHEWVRCNQEAEHVLATMDPERHVTVRYEDLCANPDETLAEVFRFLGLNPDERSTDFRSASPHVLGNGMRMDDTCEIRLDERWRSVLSAEQLDEFARIAGAMNRRYGYA